MQQLGDIGSRGGERAGGSSPRMLNPIVKAASSNAPKIGKEGKDKSPGQGSSSGGFRVEYKFMGIEGRRAFYESANRTIFINLDHPQLVAAKGNNSIEDPLFVKLSYEIAFTEYAIALAFELNNNDEYIDTSDPIIDIRDTINRIAKKAANLFSLS